MKAYNKESIDCLSDIFYAWMGGLPSEQADVKKFLQTSGLEQLISEKDLTEVMNDEAYFSEETMLAVYALVPVKLKAGKKEFAIFPQEFNKLNNKASGIKGARPVNIDFSRAAKVLDEHYPAKYKYLVEQKETLRKENKKARSKAYSPEKYRQYRASLSEEKKAEIREKSRLRMQQRRAANPEKAKADSKKYWEQMPEDKKEFYRIASRGRGKKYREANKEEIYRKRNEKLRKLREENPELLKEMYKRYNQSGNRKESSHNYYMKNKEIIAQKAKENPKTQEYKRRYKLKQRFRKSTGKIILGLLQAIADSKANS